MHTSPRLTLHLAAALLALAPSLAPAAPAAAALDTVAVEALGLHDVLTLEGSVEAVRQTTVASQVPGTILAITVKVGDLVRAGQVLARIDARAPEQGVAASQAGVAAARAQLEAVRKDYERQQQLFQKRYISQAALERAEAQFKAAQAQLDERIAQAAAAGTQTAFHTVLAPYAGVVSEVPATQGDMAAPGRPLVVLHDPSALRVSVAMPPTAAAALAASPRGVQLELPDLPPALRAPAAGRLQVLPSADPLTRQVTVRIDLPAGLRGVAPGSFARVSLPVASPASGAAGLGVPSTALLQRSGFAAVYVVDAEGRPHLRQVRPGREVAGRTELLSGVSAGERVARDAQAAAALAR